jgi:hypothetical protein
MKNKGEISWMFEEKDDHRRGITSWYIAIEEQAGRLLDLARKFSAGLFL